MNILKKIKRWYNYNFWWRKDMKIVKAQTGARCIECHAGNMLKPNGISYILCGEHKKCPCKGDECLKLKKPKHKPDFIPLEIEEIKNENYLYRCPVCNYHFINVVFRENSYHFKCNHCGYEK